MINRRGTGRRKRVSARAVGYDLVGWFRGSAREVGSLRYFIRSRNDDNRWRGQREDEIVSLVRANVSHEP